MFVINGTDYTLFVLAAALIRLCDLILTRCQSGEE